MLDASVAAARKLAFIWKAGAGQQAWCCAQGTHRQALLLAQWSARQVEPHSLSLAWTAEHRRKQGCGSALQGGGASPAGSSAVCGIICYSDQQFVRKDSQTFNTA